jgi:hypothetical protein
MADEDEVQEFTKDNPPDPGSGSFYRSKEMVFASGPHTNVKLGGKLHKGTGFIVDEAPIENRDLAAGQQLQDPRS